MRKKYFSQGNAILYHGSQMLYEMTQRNYRQITKYASLSIGLQQIFCISIKVRCDLFIQNIFRVLASHYQISGDRRDKKILKYTNELYLK